MLHLVGFLYFQLTVIEKKKKKMQQVFKQIALGNIFLIAC